MLPARSLTPHRFPITLLHQVWWEPEGGDSEDAAARRKLRKKGMGLDDDKKSWKDIIMRYACYFVPPKLQTLNGCCATMCIKVFGIPCSQRNPCRNVER